MVVRGGFGIGYNRVPQSLLLNGRLNPPLYNSPFVPGILARPYYALSSGGINSFNGFPAIPSTVLTFDPTTGFPVGGQLNTSPPNLFIVPQYFPQPMMYRYSLGMQFDLGGNWAASLGYQGSSGRHFTRATQYALIYPDNPAANYFQVVNNDVNTNFNALLAHVKKQFSSGLLVQAQYRWSKAIDGGCSTDQICTQLWQFDRHLQRSVSDFDVTHYFVANALWNIPIFRDRSKWTGQLLGGWELNGVVTASSGYPWSPVYRDNSCNQISGQGGLCPALPVSWDGDRRRRHYYLYFPAAQRQLSRRGCRSLCLSHLQRRFGSKPSRCGPQHLSRTPILSDRHERFQAFYFAPTAILG